LSGCIPAELDEPDDEVMDLVADAAFEQEENSARGSSRIA
jgi:hypothetical protein